MDYTPPFVPPPITPDSYVASMLSVLGDRDPWEVLNTTGDRLAAIVARLDEATLRRPEAPGKWSVTETIQHLADTELLYGYRLRMVATHDRPSIQGVDQDLWAEGLRYSDSQAGEAVALLKALRDANLRLLRSLSPEQWSRIGLHEERGPESIDRMFRLIAAHDIVHLRQIDRILQTVAQ